MKQMIKRNSPCPCGSKKKYKVCHGKFATKGGKFTPKPNIDKLMGSSPVTSPKDMMDVISRSLWGELHIPEGEEIIRREAIRKQEFRK